MKKLSNISLSEFRSFLQSRGLHKVRTRGGHEAWIKEGMTRAVIFQTHVSPLPEFIIANNLRNLGISKNEFLSLIGNDKNSPKD